MTKRTVAEGPGAELFLRDILTLATTEGLVEEQYELEIGGWLYDDRLATVSGVEAMIEVIDELRGSLRVIRGALIDERKRRKP